MWKLLGGLVVVVGAVVAWPYLMANSASPWPDDLDPENDVGLYIAETSGDHCLELLVTANHSGLRRSWSGQGLDELQVDVLSTAGRVSYQYATMDRSTWWHPNRVGFDEAQSVNFVLESPFHGQVVTQAVSPIRISGGPTDVQRVCDFLNHQFSVAWREGDGVLEVQLVPHESAGLASLGGEVRLAGSAARFPFVKTGDQLVASVPLVDQAAGRVLRTEVALDYNQGFGGKRVVVTLR